MNFVLVVLICCFIFLTGCSTNNSTSNEGINKDATNSYSSQKLSVSNTNENISTNEPIEEPLSSFSTKISQKDPDRQNNITLACNSLNGIIVKAGDTFSFCDTLGPAKPEEGYKKADTFDADGDTIQEYGGGKCQVSSTLYNAVLAVPSLVVVERHAHSGPVYYVEKDKDAAVAYGSIDFKFRNDNNFDIKLYVSNTPDSVYIRIVKLSK